MTPAYEWSGRQPASGITGGKGSVPRIILELVSVELVYETHAITTDNEAGVATGWLPENSPSAVTGVRPSWDSDVLITGSRVAYVSDLQRALDTASIAFDGASCPVIPDWRLRECNYGLLNGMPTERLESGRAGAPWWRAGRECGCRSGPAAQRMLSSGPASGAAQASPWWLEAGSSSTSP